MRTKILAPVSALALSALFVSSASAQWQTSFVNQTSTRLIAPPSLVVNDNLEKDFEYADFDQDGDIDLVCMRKFPGSIQGGFPDILLMNEGGVLVDRTTEYGTAADTAGSQGMRDPVNDRDVKAIDVNNDGWKDLVTATTMSDSVSTLLGQPRVYMNLGDDASGNWLGFRFEDGRIPQLFAANGATANPRFCEFVAADYTGDGYADLFFTDYDTPETSGTNCIDLNMDGDTIDAGECQQSPPENAVNDFQNKFLVNQGAANPGYFVDSTTTRFTAAQLAAGFGNAVDTADFNGDGHLDIVRVNTLTGGQDVAIFYANPANLGNSFIGPDSVSAVAPYEIDVGDLNNDGRIDLVVVDDGQDKFLINQGNGADGLANWISYTIADSAAEFGNQTRVIDLDKDGKLDVLITDVDADLPAFCPSTGRRSHIYRNTGTLPTLLDEIGEIIPYASASAVFDFATFDINGDTWPDVVIGKCAGIEVWMNSPPIGLTFSYPSGRPATIAPASEVSFPVTISILGAGSIEAGTPKLMYSIDHSAWTPRLLTPTGGNNFSATLPAVNCGQELRYYVTAQYTGGAFYNDPATAPTTFYTVPVQTGEYVAYSDAIEGSVAGWSTTTDASATAGAWVAVVPVGAVSGGVQTAPATDATAKGTKAWITGLGVAGGLAGAQDLDGGPVTLSTPAYDLAGFVAARVSFAAWFYCDDATTTPAQQDYLRVDLSNDNGATWIVMASIGSQGSGWLTKTYNLDAFLPLTSTMKLRFFVTDNPNNSLTEAGIDDLTISVIECTQAICAGDLDSSGTVDAADISALLGAWGLAGGDVDGNSVTDAADLATLLGNWGPCN